MRETYRLNKHALKSTIEEKDSNIAVFFMFTGKELPDYYLILEKMKQVLEKLEKSI